MDVSSINGAGLADSTSSLVPQTFDKDTFLKILVESMKQQDPFASQDSGAFLSQMAEFSNVEQTQNLNQSVFAMVTLMSQNAAIQDLSAGSALIGQNAQYTDDNGNKQIGVVESVSIGSNGTFLKINGDLVPLLRIEEVLGAPQS